MGTLTQNSLLDLLVMALVVAMLVIEFAPPVLSFGLVALAVGAWCSWLDSHPIQ